MTAGYYNILYLSNRNTTRSIFAEAVANGKGCGRFKGYSAMGGPPMTAINQWNLTAFQIISCILFTGKRVLRRLAQVRNALRFGRDDRCDLQSPRPVGRSTR